ncbi:MAG: hypothetical protein K6B40_02615 [Firmicutes bacterium]|nr:hypothetical protein [Bacillota bacterium]
MTVTFCGHADYSGEKAVREWLATTVDALITRGAGQFLLGGYGGFDREAAAVVWEAKERHPHIASTLVLPYLDRTVFACQYDGTTYPPLESVPRRFAISKRNEWMVQAADIVVAYVLHGWGGAAAMLRCALRKKKEVIRYVLPR